MDDSNSVRLVMEHVDSVHSQGFTVDLIDTDEEDCFETPTKRGLNDTDDDGTFSSPSKRTKASSQRHILDSDEEINFESVRNHDAIDHSDAKPEAPYTRGLKDIHLSADYIVDLTRDRYASFKFVEGYQLVATARNCPHSESAMRYIMTIIAVIEMLFSLCMQIMLERQEKVREGLAL